MIYQFSRIFFFQGYGFVHFETEEAALSAIQKVNGMLLNGKKVFVGRFVPRKDREIELGEKAKMFTNVFIKNLSEDVEEGALLEMFEAFGKITSLKVMKGTCKVLSLYMKIQIMGGKITENWGSNHRSGRSKFFVLFFF